MEADSKRFFGALLVAMFLAIVLGCVMGTTISDYNNTNRTINKAQSYMDQKFSKVKNLTVKVSNCVALPTKADGDKPNWACRVTVTYGKKSQTEIVQFTQNNLAGKEDPEDEDDDSESPTPKFDHSKDTNI